MKFAIEVECYGPAPDDQLACTEIEKLYDGAKLATAQKLTDLGCVVLDTDIVDTGNLRYAYEREQMLHASCRELLERVRAEHDAAKRRVRELEEALGNLACAGEG